MTACFEENEIDVEKVFSAKTPWEFDHYFTR